MTRVAVVSDTHMPRGSRRLPDACARELEAADLILHCGDICTQSVLDELRRYAPVEAVHGNMDTADLRQSLPVERVVEVDAVRVGMIHVGGPRAGREERLVERFPRCDAVVYGHTHVPQVDRHAGVWVLNPGSPTERRRAPQRSMLVLHVAGGEIEPELVAV